MESKAVISWVSMNPPTKNHDKLISEMKDYVGTKILFIEKTESFPLSYETRLEAANEAFPEIIMDHDFENIMEAVSSLSELFENITILVNESDMQYMEDAMEIAEAEGVCKSKWSVVSNNMLDVDFGSVDGVRHSHIKEAYLDGNTDLLEEILPSNLSYIPESLTVSQRIKKGNEMKRRGAVLQNARKRVLARHAEKTRLQGRSRKEAIGTMKQKLAGGQKVADLSYGDKARIEDILKTKKGAVNNLSRKLLNKVRDRENARHASHSDNRGK